MAAGEALLRGLRVIDLGTFVASPSAATMLGDYGADVRVEKAGPIAIVTLQGE